MYKNHLRIKKVNVASSDRRYFIIISLVLFAVQTSYPMVMDNRYFPWIDQFYTGSNYKHGNLLVEGFFITGGDAYRTEDKANKDEQVVSLSEIYGELKLADVGKSLQNAGETNPIPADWQWLSDFKAKINNSLEGQGITIGGYIPITKHFGVGGSTLMMRLNSLTEIIPHSETVTKLYLDSPGNQARFTKMMSDFYDKLSICGTTSQEIAAGDTVAYISFHDVREYCIKMRTIDWGIWIGAIMPTGARWDQSNLGSLPYGGNGMWGAFVAPRFEFELREDLKFGMHARVTKRFGREVQHRIPIGDEQPLFAPFLDSMYINPGVSFTGSAYVAFEDVSAGLGLLGKYTVTYHAEDTFSTNVLKEKSLTPNFKNLTYRSSFVSEYATIRLFYDVGHDKTWKHRPVISFTWDIPRNHIGGKAFGYTHRVSLGCTVNF